MLQRIADGVRLEMVNVANMSDVLDGVVRSYISLRLFMDDVLNQVFPGRALRTPATDDRFGPRSSTDAENHTAVQRGGPSITSPQPLPNGRMPSIVETQAKDIRDRERLEEALMQLKQLAAAYGTDSSASGDRSGSKGASSTGGSPTAFTGSPPSPLRDRRRVTTAKVAPTLPLENAAASGSFIRATDFKPVKRNGFHEVLVAAAVGEAARDVNVTATLAMLSPSAPRGTGVGHKPSSGEGKMLAPRREANVPRDAVRKPIAEYTREEVAVALLSRFGSA